VLRLNDSSSASALRAATPRVIHVLGPIRADLGFNCPITFRSILHIDQGVKPCDCYDLITGDLQKKRNPPNRILNMTDRGTGTALRVQCSSHFVFYDILLDRERERERERGCHRKK